MALLLELDPLIITGEVTELQVGHLEVGEHGVARLADGREVDGRIRYVDTDAGPASRTFTVGDIATVRPTFKDPVSFSRVNGKPSITLFVVKRVGENVIATIEQVRAVAAYLVAAQRMAMPIISSTATTLAAFMPLLFWPDVVGEFMKYLPITLIATLSASLVMALVFVPTLGALFGKPGPASAQTMRSLAAAEGGDLGDLHGFTGS